MSSSAAVSQSSPAPTTAPAASQSDKYLITQVALACLTVVAFATCALALAGKLPNMGSVTLPTTLLVGVTCGSIAFGMVCLMGLLYVSINKEKNTPPEAIKVIANDEEIQKLQAEIAELKGNQA